MTLGTRLFSWSAVRGDLFNLEQIDKNFLCTLPKDKLPVSSKKELVSFSITIAIYVDESELGFK